MEKIFLIGGSGFIGKNLVRCLSPYYQISIFDKYIDHDFFADYPSVNVYQLDLVADNIPSEIIAPDYIINLVSIVTAERDLSLFDELISSNLKVLLNLYERFKDTSSLKLFIQFGSSEEYGSISSPFKEENREYPNSPYALVKQLTTNTALMLHRNYGFPAMVVRPGNLFGPGQNKNKFIPYVIDKLRKGESLNVSPCEQKRDFIYVDDFAWCVGRLIKNYPSAVGEIVNVASGKSISLRNIIEICKASMGNVSQINYGALPYRENEMMDLKCSENKLASIISQEVNFNMNERLNEYIQKL